MSGLNQYYHNIGVADGMDGGYSDTITIINNPILTGGRAYAFSSDEAKLEWTNDASATSYQIRYRQLGDYNAFLHASADHTSLGWPRGRTWPYYHPAETEDSDTPGNETIVGPIDGELYAFRVNYNTSAGMVFSAREAYAWPSDRPAVNGETVATFPLNNFLRDRTYSYYMCKQSFPEGRGEDWARFIKDTMYHWATSTDGPIRMEHLDDIPEGSGICADFGEDVDEIVDDVNAIQPTLTKTEIKAYVESVLDTMHDLGMRRMEQVTANGIWMIGSTSDTSDVFYEVSRLVARGTCGSAEACAVAIAVDEGGAIKRGGDWLLKGAEELYVHPDYDYYIDILLTERLLGDPPTPPNTPPYVASLVDTNNRSRCPEIYQTLLHEAGHALGIGYRNTPYVNYRTLRLYRHHSWTEIGPTLMRITSCTPTPFDIMAIYALYQTYQGAE